MTYRLWWTVGYVCTTEKEFKATRHRLLPAVYEALDDALRRANQIGRAGGVAWLIEGDDKISMDRSAIESAISKRSAELAVQLPVTVTARR